ncbi:MAG TPA: Ig-like domain-containing protein [Candidatus Limnocylindrales bacterium]|nr:Ig-like domain-containing protein [Candidatus Limnocylindrales bacterium]
MPTVRSNKKPYNNKKSASSKNKTWINGLKNTLSKTAPKAVFVIAFAMLGSYLVFKSHAASILNPQTTWAACANGGFYAPLSDSAAAALVTPQPEVRPKNAAPYAINGIAYPSVNAYVPNTAELASFYNAKNKWGETALVANPYNKYVTGNSTLTNPSTDDLIQWTAHKWGIPEDWLRAQYVAETWWNHFGAGDLNDLSQSQDYTTDPRNGVIATPDTVSNWYGQEPSLAKYPDPATPNPPYPQVYESLGISQVKWRPNLSVGSGTEPLRWKSLAFNIDLHAAAVRFYYDDPGGKRTSWGDTSYVRCQDWNSIGGWYQPSPWANSGQLDYVAKVQNYLNNRTWTTASFINATFAFPSVITFGSIANDTQAPTAPASLTAAAQSVSQINLSWSASSDNIGVTGYDIYRNSAKIGTVATTSYSDSGLSASTSYGYYVIAHDATGNTSPPSNTANATTSANPVTQADTVAPSVSLSSPTDGAKIGRSVSVKASAADNIQVTKLEVYIDGSPRTSSTGSNFIGYNWNSRKANPGSHTITVKAYDAAGNVGQSSVTVYK